MRFIDKLTSDAAQSYKLLTDDGSQFNFSLRYRPAIQCWTFDLTWKNYTVNGIRLVNSINLLRQWHDIFPFGLVITSTDILEPQYIDDFTSGRIKVYVLNATEILDIENRLFI